jgi:hypothetical protein
LTIKEFIRKLRPVLGQKADALLFAYRITPNSRAEIAGSSMLQPQNTEK